jgi:hypothetical protein
MTDVTVTQAETAQGERLWRVEAGSVGDAARAQAVVEALEVALDHCLAEEDYPHFRYHVLFDERPDGWAVTPEALTEDARGAGAEPELADTRAAYTAEVAEGTQACAFWAHVGRLEGGAEVVRQWLATVEAAFAKVPFNEPWEMGEAGLQLGETAVMALALENVAWVPAYTRLLTFWDLGHEVHQRFTIDALYARHGWCPEIRALLRTRAETDSQWGAEQVFADYPAILAKDISPQDWDAFFLDALAGFRDACADWMVWPPEENTCRTFGIAGRVKALADSLPPASKEGTT